MYLSSINEYEIYITGKRRNFSIKWPEKTKIDIFDLIQPFKPAALECVQRLSARYAVRGHIWLSVRVVLTFALR